MSTLAVIGYDDQFKAEAVRLDLCKMQKDYLNGVPTTPAIKETTLSAQVPLQVGPFHTSGSSMISRTASGGRFFSTKARTTAPRR